MSLFAGMVTQRGEERLEATKNNCVNILRNQFSLFLAMQQVGYGYLLGNFSSHPFSQVCVFACTSVCKGVSGAPSSSGCSRGSGSLCHTALETEFIVAQVLQDHLCFHRLHRHHPHSGVHVIVCLCVCLNCTRANALTHA